MPGDARPALPGDGHTWLRAVHIFTVRLAALRSPGLFPGRKKDRHTRRLTKTRADHAWLFEIES
jgi:hypothetical protein